MRVVKYISFCLFTMLIFLLSGECYQLYAGDGNIGYEIYMSDMSDESIEDLLEYNECDDMHLYIECMESGKRVIYCDQPMKEILINDYQVVEGTTPSLFLGSTTYEFHEFSEYIIPENKDYNYVHVYCPDKDSDNLYEIYQRFGFDAEENYSYMGENGYALLFVGIVAALLMLVLTYYECLLEGKKLFVQMTNGHELKRLVIGRIAGNLCTYILLLVVLILVMQNITYIYFVKKVTFAIFCLFLVADSCLYLCLFRMNARQVLTTPFSSMKVLSLNRGIYVVVMVLSALVLVKAVEGIEEAGVEKGKYDFFEEKKDYCNVMISGALTDYAEEYLLQHDALIYSELENKYEVIRIQAGGSIGSAYSEHEVKMNQAAAKYIGDWIGELEDYEFDESYYIILSENEEMTQDKLEAWKKELYSSGVGKEEPIILTYSGEYSLPAINGAYEISSVEQPVILLINKEIDIVDVENAPIDNWLQGCIVGASEEELSRYEEKYGVILQLDRPWDVLSEEAETRELVLKVCVLGGIVLLITSVAVLATIIRLTFVVEGKELCLRRILGYTHFEQMQSVYRMIFENSIVAWLITFGFKHDSIGEVLKVTVCTGVLLVVSVMVTVALGNILQRRNAVKILKGGAL